MKTSLHFPLKSMQSVKITTFLTDFTHDLYTSTLDSVDWDEYLLSTAVYKIFWRNISQIFYGRNENRDITNFWKKIQTSYLVFSQNNLQS